MHSPRTVHILLATYQGGRHLEAQLESIARQTHPNWTLLVSDDGSTDNSPAIVQRFAAAHRQPVTLLQGPSRGATANFFHLINTVSYADPADLFAFCDQDDWWLPEKLAVAAACHEQFQRHAGPVLYCGRTRITNDALQPIGESETPRKPLTLGNALTQNVASGNTMVFNARLLEILRHIQPQHSVWHDWSAYLAATACGGVVHYDVEPHMLYRQHAGNVIGAIGGSVDRIVRLLPSLKGRYRLWGDLTEAAMQDIAPHLTPDAQMVFEAYKLARHARTGLQRIHHARTAGISRQTRLGQIALLAGLYAGLA